MPDNFSTWPDTRSARANELTSGLHADVLAWNTRQLVTSEFVLSEDARTVESVLRVAEPPPLESFSLQVSEIIHHSRGALDTLTWELCCLGGEPLFPRKVMFPTRLKASQWPAAAGELAPMPDLYLERIHRIQPFQTPTPETEGLRVLQRLSNWDKHRGIVEASTQMGITGRVNVGLPPGRKFDARTWENPQPQIVDGEVLHRLEFGYEIQLEPKASRVRLNWQLHDAETGQRFSLDGFIRIIRSIPAVLEFLRTGKGDMVSEIIEPPSI